MIHEATLNDQMFKRKKKTYPVNIIHFHYQSGYLLIGFTKEGAKRDFFFLLISQQVTHLQPILSAPLPHFIFDVAIATADCHIFQGQRTMSSHWC